MAIILYLILFFLPAIGWAQVGLGGVANNLMDPLSIFYSFIHSACLLVGGLFLFASLVKYREHKRSPTLVPMSTVVFLIIAGTVLLLLPLISFFKVSGYHLN